MARHREKWMKALLINLEAKKKGEKYCATCEQVLPFEKFCKDKRMSSGLKSYCRACESIRYKKYTDSFKTKAPAGD